MKQHYHTWHLGTCMNCGANQRKVLADQKAAGLAKQRDKRALARTRSAVAEAHAANVLEAIGGAK